jgi:hypothetical protein
MSKTKELVVICSAARIDPNRYGHVSITLEDPDVEEICNGINRYDMAEWVKGNQYTPTDLFDKNELHEWATENGYIKSINE